jgi:hypothetical protein
MEIALAPPPPPHNQRDTDGNKARPVARSRTVQYILNGLPKERGLK